MTTAKWIRTSRSGRSLLKTAVSCVILMGAGLVVLLVLPEGIASRLPASNGLAPYLSIIKEVSGDRRLNVLHPNAQSIFDGHSLGLVNVSSGNLTFRRRDLVAYGNSLLIITGSPEKVYIIKETRDGVKHCWEDDEGNKTYEESKFPGKFYREVNENGSGKSTKYGAVQIEWVCTNDKPSSKRGRPSDFKRRTYRDLNSTLIKPACPGGSLSETTVAVYRDKYESDPGPNEQAFNCGHALFASRSGGASSKKTVTDNCPKCAEAPPHVDHFTHDGSCEGIVDWAARRTSRTYKLPW